MIRALNNIENYKFPSMKIINEFSLYGYISLTINEFINRSTLEIHIYLVKISNAPLFNIFDLRNSNTSF